MLTIGYTLFDSTTSLACYLIATWMGTCILPHSPSMCCLLSSHPLEESRLLHACILQPYIAYSNANDRIHSIRFNYIPCMLSHCYLDGDMHSSSLPLYVLLAQ